MRLIPHVPPEQMTPRARLYLTATSVYCLLIGLICLCLTDMFGSASFVQIKKMLPGGMTGWGIAHLFIFSNAFWAVWRGNEKWAWRTLMGASALVGPWAAGFWWALGLELWRDDGLTILPTGAVAYSFITAIHIIQARQPMRSPFDPLLRTTPPSHSDA